MTYPTPDGRFLPPRPCQRKPPVTSVFHLLLPLCLSLVIMLVGCSTGGSATTVRAVPPTALVTDGPPLALVGEYAGMRLEGYMDRNCMAGYGGLGLRAVSPYRRGDMAVPVPSLPEKQIATGADSATSATQGLAAPLALAAYPAKKSQKAGEAGTQVKPSPTASITAASARRGKGLILAAYPQEDTPPPSDTRMPEEKSNELLPDEPRLRTQAANAAEYESSEPVTIEFVCEAKVDAPPTNKARIRGIMECTGGKHLLFSLRNTGPDQGVGVGKETEDSSLMVLFYHASIEEARRRLPTVREEILFAQQQQR